MNTRLHPGRCSPCLTGTFVFLLARRYSPPQLRSPFPLQSLITVFFHRRPPPTVSQPVGAESATPVAERPGESDLLSSDEEPDSQGPLYAADSQPMGIPTASEGIPFPHLSPSRCLLHTLRSPLALHKLTFPADFAGLKAAEDDPPSPMSMGDEEDGEDGVPPDPYTSNRVPVGHAVWGPNGVAPCDLQPQEGNPMPFCCIFLM